MEKILLRTIVVFGLILGAYFCLFDIVFEFINWKISTGVKGLLFGLGFWLGLRSAVRHLKKKLSFRLKYWQAAITCLATSLFSLFLYRLYCLLVYTDAEVFYLLNNHERLLRSILSLLGLSLLCALGYKTKPSTADVPKEIDDMYDIDINEKKGK